MERASKLIRGLRLSEDVLSAGDLACAAWPLAVGPRIAAHTRACRMVRTRLIVEVEDRIWQRQLFALTPQILGNLAKSVGGGLVEDLEFRIMPPRRDAQRAEAAQPGAPATLDDADQIADPVMRNMYKQARKKALA